MLDFFFEFLSQGGPQLGEDIFERHYRFRFDAKNEEIHLEQHRNDLDKPGDTIGRYLAKAPKETFENLGKILEGKDFNEIKPNAPVDFGASLFVFTYQTRNDRIVRKMSSKDIALIQKMRPLFSLITKTWPLIKKHPIESICVEPSIHENKDGYVFALTIKNTSEMPLYIGDPRYLKRDHDNWAGVQVAELPEERPGVTSPPLKWSRLFLSRPKGQKEENPKPILLRPQNTFTAKTEKWTPPKANANYLAQAVLINYEGPPFFKGPEDKSEKYFIRGGVFSKGLEFSPRH